SSCDPFTYAVALASLGRPLVASWKVESSESFPLSDCSLKASSAACVSLKTTQSPTSIWTDGGVPLASSASNFPLSVACVIATNCGEPVAFGKTTKSTSGPSSGRTSLLKSTPPLPLESAELIAANSLSWLGNFRSSVSAFFHCVELSSVSTDANASALAGAIVAPDAPPEAEPDLEPPQPAATSATATSGTSSLRTSLMLLPGRTPTHQTFDQRPQVGVTLE